MVVKDGLAKPRKVTCGTGKPVPMACQRFNRFIRFGYGQILRRLRKFHENNACWRSLIWIFSSAKILFLRSYRVLASCWRS